MMDDSNTIEELLAGQEVSNHHKVSMISENIKNDKLTILQETQQPNFGSVKAENGGRERASLRTWTEGKQLLRLSHVKWST